MNSAIQLIMQNNSSISFPGESKKVLFRSAPSRACLFAIINKTENKMASKFYMFFFNCAIRSHKISYPFQTYINWYNVLAGHKPSLIPLVYCFGKTYFIFDALYLKLLSLITYKDYIPVIDTFGSERMHRVDSILLLLSLAFS